MFHSKLLHCQSAHTNQHFTPRATLACQATFRARQARCQDDLSRLHAPFTVDLRGWESFETRFSLMLLMARMLSLYIPEKNPPGSMFHTKLVGFQLKSVQLRFLFSLSKPPFLWMRSPVSWWFICSYPNISFYVPISID